MAAALDRYERPHRLIIYQDVGHGFIPEFIVEADEWLRLHKINLD